jgi:hypothetical protein
MGAMIKERPKRPFTGANFSAAKGAAPIPEFTTGLLGTEAVALQAADL